MNRLVCLGWISKLERKENFSFETRVAPLRTPTVLLDVISDAVVTQWLPGTNPDAQRNAFHRGGRPQSGLFAELSFSRARDSAFFVFRPATTK
jgi:hypothetical protein